MLKSILPTLLPKPTITSAAWTKMLEAVAGLDQKLPALPQSPQISNPAADTQALGVLGDLEHLRAQAAKQEADLKEQKASEVERARTAEMADLRAHIARQQEELQALKLLTRHSGMAGPGVVGMGGMGGPSAAPYTRGAMEFPGQYQAQPPTHSQPSVPYWAFMQSQNENKRLKVAVERMSVLGAEPVHMYMH